jgi:putative membrane protein
MRNVFACGAVVLAFCAAPVFAQTPKSTQTQQKASTAEVKPDQNFVMKAAEGGMAEVELGKLAAEKASSSDVKNFGQKMADDHGKANDELKQLAEKKNITLPTAISAKDKATYNRLSKLSGAAFDRAYMQDMLKDHQTDISEFQYEARSGADSEFRGFASKTLPTLQEHLKMAQTTNGAVATSGARSKAATTGTTGAR